MFPRINIFLDRISSNIRKLQEVLSPVEIMGVTKGVCGDPYIAREMVNNGIRYLGDSRIQNIKRMRAKGIDARIFQIRSPQLSEIRETVKYADGAFVSELKIVKALSEKSREIGKKFAIIVMVELGDLREGVLPRDMPVFIKEAIGYGANIVGIGTNLGCFGGVIPTREKMENLLGVRDKIESMGIELEIVSGGATDTISLFENGKIQGINQLRIGEAILIGHDTTGNRKIDYLRQDTFIIEAEIIELKEKPSMPYGIIGRDAFGNIPHHVDRGIRKRAILALGRQDIDFEYLIPLEKGVEILGGSSDHMVVDVTDSKNVYEIGDVMSFYPLYPSLLKSMCSSHVKKRYVKGS